MKKYNYLLYGGDVYYEDNKNLKFIQLKNPDISVSYSDLNPDELDKFKQILPGEKSEHYRTPPEKIYRTITDLSNVLYLNNDTFDNLSKQINNYLEEIEDYERMCVIRDLKEFYFLEQKRKQAQIEDRIKHFNKAKK